MRLLRATLFLAALSTSAFAQPQAFPGGGDLSRGVTLPPTTAALVDEATAPVLNPAGLAQLKSLQFIYLHDRNLDQDLVSDGVFLGARAFGALGMGVSVEWIRPSFAGEIQRRKTNWALSLGSRALSLGAGLGFYDSDFDPLDDAVSLDVGLMSRPSEVLSIGAAIRNVNQPDHSSLPADGIPFNSPPQLTRTYDFAFGVRPVGNRLTLSAGYTFADDFPGKGRVSLIAQAEAVRGLVLGAGFSKAIFRDEHLAMQFSATFDLPHFGLTYAPATAGDGPVHVIQARISGEAYSGMRPGNQVAVIDLSERLTRPPSSALLVLGGEQVDPYLELMQLLSQAERDTSLGAVVLKFESLPDFGMARADEVRQAIQRLRQSGKKVVSVIFSADDPEYFAAAASDRVWVVPQSMLLINGLSASVTYLGKAMEKLGVKWDVARVGKYKNAPDQLTRSDMSPEQREVIDAWLDAESNQLLGAIAQMRNIPIQQVSAAQKVGLLTPKQAAEFGLVDGVVMPQELEGKLKEFILGGQLAGEYRLIGAERGGWGNAPEIAIVPIVGTISSGESRSDPIGAAEVAGVETVVSALTQAAADPSVKAIVLRVDSGGGDALASDLMFRAVVEARKKKPVIASMGNLAASGGYYAAMGAQKIYADPTTLTGSIGVFILKPAFGPLANKLGIYNQTLKRGDLSTLFNAFDTWTPEEQAAAQKWVDAFYDDFITEVSKARDLPKEQVDQIARGRVWSGTAAKDLKLVDELGTLLDAIDAARREAQLPEKGNWRIRLIGQTPGFGVASPPFLSTALPEPLRRTIESLGIPSMTILEPGLKAQQPWEIRIK